jgi:hypothetical protein
MEWMDERRKGNRDWIGVCWGCPGGWYVPVDWRDAKEFQEEGESQGEVLGGPLNVEGEGEGL